MTDEPDINDQAYNKMLAQLLEQHQGEWALFDDGELIDFFDTEEEAAQAGSEYDNCAWYLIEEDWGIGAFMVL